MMTESRPVDLLRDSKGVYGIGIVYDDVLRKQNSSHKHLILRSDVLKDSAIFPNEYRKVVLQTLGNHYVSRSFSRSYEWKLHGVMLDQALKRNPRYQELEEGGEAWSKESDCLLHGCSDVGEETEACRCSLVLLYARRTALLSSRKNVGAATLAKGIHIQRD
jgi:hypothetical protein